MNSNSNSNYLKYLKYKKKYLDLKNKSKILYKKGGTNFGNDIFILYTTGMGNNLEAYAGNTSNQNISQYYEKYRDNLFNQITSKYPNHNIIVNHYDPLLIDDITQEQVNRQSECIEFLQNLSIRDIQYENVIESTFIVDELTENTVDIGTPHLILDLGHVFTYTESSDIQQIGVTYSRDGVPPRDVENLNILRFGFLGDNIPQSILGTESLLFAYNNTIITLTKLILIKLPNLANLYLIDPIYDIFEKLIYNGYSQLEHLPRVNSVTHVLSNIISKENNLPVSVSDLIIRKNIGNDIYLLINISQNIIRFIENDYFRPDISLNEEGREILNEFIYLVSDNVKGLINLDL